LSFDLPEGVLVWMGSRRFNVNTVKEQSVLYVTETIVAKQIVFDGPLPLGATLCLNWYNITISGAVEERRFIKLVI
jgi:hypothetical protein